MALILFTPPWRASGQALLSEERIGNLCTLRVRISASAVGMDSFVPILNSIIDKYFSSGCSMVYVRGLESRERSEDEQDLFYGLCAQEIGPEDLWRSYLKTREPRPKGFVCDAFALRGARMFRAIDKQGRVRVVEEKSFGESLARLLGTRKSLRLLHIFGSGSTLSPERDIYLFFTMIPIDELATRDITVKLHRLLSLKRDRLLVYVSSERWFFEHECYPNGNPWLVQRRIEKEEMFLKTTVSCQTTGGKVRCVLRKSRPGGGVR